MAVGCVSRNFGRRQNSSQERKVCSAKKKNRKTPESEVALRIREMYPWDLFIIGYKDTKKKTFVKKKVGGEGGRYPSQGKAIQGNFNGSVISKQFINR